MHDPRYNDLSPAEDAFARFLEEREGGGTSFEAFCGEHPELADDLRKIRAGFEWVDDILEEAPAAVSEVQEANAPAFDFHDSHERYEIREEVARGGMAIVLRVYDRDLKRVLAMKVLKEATAGQRRAEARFTEEAQVTSQLDHPSIVPIHDMGKLRDGRVFYTMPLVAGRDLSAIFELARSGADGWSVTRVLGVLQRVCEAVGAAHERGVVHRDLKPANVMVGAHGEVYVMDWGLARVLEGAQIEGEPTARPASTRREVLDQDPTSSVGTVDGQVLGTPSYMSPEQARGAVDEVGCSSDVYSAGAMLYELLTGSRPYVAQGERPDTHTLLERVLAGPPQLLHARVSGVPAELSAICERAMARTPDARYPDMGALGDDLRAYLEQRVVGAYRTGAAAELVKWVQRNRGLSIAIGVALLALIAGLLSTTALKREADAQAARATANFEAALDAVDRMLTQVGFGDLSDVPGAQAVRAVLLEDALEFYEGFLEQEGNDLDARLRVAHAHGRLADIYGGLEDSSASIHAYERALTDLEQLREDYPEQEARIDRNIVFQSVDLAKAHVQALDYGAAAEVLPEALEQVDALLERTPDDVQLVAQRATVYQLLGNAHEELGREDAEDWYLAAIEVGEALAAGDPDDHPAGAVGESEQRLASALNVYATFLLREQRVEEAREPLERAVALREQGLLSEPHSRSRRANLSESLMNLTMLLAQVEPGSADAVAAGERSVELAEQLVFEYPNIPYYVHALGLARTNLALVSSERGEHERAIGLLAAAVDDTQVVLARAPGEELLKRGLYALYRNLFWVHFAAGHYVEIAARAPELPRVDPEGPSYWRTAATAYAYCAENVQKDLSLSLETREQYVEGYLAEMAEYFYRMVDLGIIEPEYLDEEWFTAVRDHPIVIDLVNELTDLAAQQGRSE